jgi:hypothetical protein
MTELVTINDSTSNVHDHCGVVTARGAQGNSALLEVDVSGKTYIVHNCFTRELGDVEALRAYAGAHATVGRTKAGTGELRRNISIRDSYEHALTKCLRQQVLSQVRNAFAQ